MKRRVFCNGVAGSVMLATLGLSSLSACAHVDRPPQWGTRLGALMQIAVVERDSGRELPIYRHRGEFWVAGTPGQRYAIRARNAGSARVMAVMSVDGINVISGETAGTGQTGYVFGAGEGGEIAGWRKSDAQIAAFEFTALGDSYASRTGRPEHVGVIGVALFRERAIAPPAPPPIARSDSSAERERRAEAPAAGAAAPSQDMAASESSAAKTRPSTPAPSLGTGHGRRESSYVGRTSFERAQSTPDELIRIRYDSRENLVAAGVIPQPTRWPRVPGPSPFPESNAGYVPDPPARY